MEVWLESLSMHLSVCMPIPSDLLFDIYNYRGTSPSSSGSTTPEGMPSENRSPNLKTIKEGKAQSDTVDGAKKTPDYELEKNVAIPEPEKTEPKTPEKPETATETVRSGRYVVTGGNALVLRKVPKTFARNRFRHCQEISRVTELNNMTRLPKTVPVSVSDHQLKADAPAADFSRSYSTPDARIVATPRGYRRGYSSDVVDRSSDYDSDTAEYGQMPDIVSSCTIKKAGAGSKYTQPVVGKYHDDYIKPCASSSKASSLVRNIVDNLNRNERNVGGSERASITRGRNVGVRNRDVGKGKARSSSPIESTAL